MGGKGEKGGIRWRGGEISRIEGFSDAVFAFALTLLVVSLEVPKSFGELMGTMQGFAAFAICFVSLVYIWRAHYLFFRRFGLEDTTTMVLNAVLLFVVLFYVYPLKFLFTMLVKGFTGWGPLDLNLEDAVKPWQWSPLMAVYSAGYVAVFGLFAILYTHAYRRRATLELTELEAFDTRLHIQSHLLNAGVGFVSIGLATLKAPALAGWCYLLVGPVLTVHGSVMGSRRRKLEEKSDPRPR